jgi:hypothetical protein
MSKCERQFDLYSDMCMDCGENDKTIKLYEACRKNYLDNDARNQDNKIVNNNEKGISEGRING